MNTRNLSALQVAVALATTHYGLGFLVGTGQDIVEYGPAGMLYAFSTAVGLLALIPISAFYWKKREPIWDLFTRKHGELSGKFTAFLSSFWMLGVIASQIVGGSAALMAFGMPRFMATAIIAGLILALSYIDLGKLSKIFFAFLLLSSGIVVTALFRFGSISPIAVPGTFFQSLPTLPLDTLLGVLLTTVLITFIGMDFHQFIVDAKSPNQARQGAFAGFIILALLTSILGASILGYLSSGSYTSASSLVAAQIVPKMLMETGASFLGQWSRVLFLLPIILVSAGSGSAVTKVIVKASQELIPRYAKSRSLNISIVGVCVGLTFLSQSVIGLVVSFYATYVGAVFVPFLVLFLENKGIVKFKNFIFFNAILLGFSLSVLIFIAAKFGVLNNVDTTLLMLLSGFLGSTVIFCTAGLAERISLWLTRFFTSHMKPTIILQKTRKRKVV